MNLSVDTVTSFLMQESTGFYNFADLMISLGNKYGPMKSEDILFKRKAIKEHSLKLVSQITQKLKDGITKSEGLSFTSDIWSSRYTQDSFLEVHATWIQDFTMIVCQVEMCHFDVDNSAENIKKELKRIFWSF